MPQHDYVIDNAAGSAVRSDFNDVLAAIGSNNSGGTAPSTTFADMLWADTSVTPNLMKIRNAGDSAWKSVFSSDGQIRSEAGTVLLPGHSFTGDPNTGASNPSGDTYVISTGGVENIRVKTSEVVFNDAGNDIDFRIETTGKTHAFFVDAGNDRVIIGANSGVGTFDISHATLPKLVLSEEDQAGDEKKWQFSVSDSDLFISPIPDAGGIGVVGLQITRGAADTVTRYFFSSGQVALAGERLVGAPDLIWSPIRPDSGLYEIADDHVGIAVSGVKAWELDASSRMGLGVTPLTNMAAGDMVFEGGSLVLKEITTPTADLTYGKIYFKADNKIYAQTGDGVEHELAFA